MTDSRFVPNTAQRETVGRDYSSPVVGWERKCGEYSNESAVGGGFAGVAMLESGLRVTVGRYGAVLSEDPPSAPAINGGSTMHDPTFTTAHEHEAYELGAQAAVAAASWVLDGNTAQEHIARMVAWLDDGDPRADDFLPAMPDLSGEWADDPTPDRLADEITDGHAGSLSTETVDRIADAWEAGVSGTFQPECERLLRAALVEPEEDTSEEPCTEHGFDVCPDCGNAGTKIDSTGYVPCTRFLTCWADLDDETEG